MKTDIMAKYKLNGKPSVVLPECWEMLRLAAKYIAKNSPAQARIMRTQFYEVAKMIERMPRIGAIHKKGMRKIKLGKFRYYVYYREKEGIIEILGIWHTSRGAEF